MDAWRIAHGSQQPLARISQPSQTIYEQAYGETSSQLLTSPMSARDTSDGPDNNVPAPTFTERVRDLAVGRRSFPSLRGARSRFTGSSAIQESGSTIRQESSHGRHVDPETVFREKYVLQLDPNQPAEERIRSLRAAAQEIPIYSVDTLMAIWAVAEDFTLATASLENRLAGYDLLLASVSHSGIDSEERLKFFNVIKIWLPPAHASLQVSALEGLTQQGKQLSPFEADLAVFLNGLLEQVFEAAVQARSFHGRQRSQRSTDPIGEEVSLTNLLALIERTVKRSPDVFHDGDLATLIQRLLAIVTKTTARHDINQAMVIFECLTTYPSFPITSVETCVEVLCAMCGNPILVSEGATRCLHKMLTSEYQSETLKILLKLISISPEEAKPHVLLGAFSTVDHVLVMNGADDFPVIPLQPLSVAFGSVWHTSRSFTADCLRILGRLLHDDQINDRLLGENWALLENILDEVASIANESPGPDKKGAVFKSRITSSSPLYRYFSNPWSRLYTDNLEVQKRLRRIASAFEGLWDKLNRDQRLSVINLFLVLEPYIDDDLLDLTVQFMADERLIYPPNENWSRHLEVLVELVLFNPLKAESTRCRVMQKVKDVYDATENDWDSRIFFEHIDPRIIEAMLVEDKVQLLNAQAEFTAQYALEANIEVFDRSIETLSQLIGVERVAGSAIRTSAPFESLPHLTACLVRLFLQCLPRSAWKAMKIYKVLVSIAANLAVPPKARLTSMKLLARLRCNQKHAIKVVPIPDSQGLAATLCRSDTSFQSRTNRVSFNEETQVARVGRSSAIGSSRSDRSRSATRSASGKERLARPTPPLWVYGGSKGLPEDPPAEFSEFVHALADGLVAGPKLDISLWMDKVNDVLLKGDDWEIYSYLLVHLPSQLSNPALFKAEAPHLRNLHALIISQLQTGKVHTPPATTGIKQGDVALCLLHSLTILVTYRERFTKKQLDDTVRTFLVSMEKWDGVRKCCIHALALCSHELPFHLDKYLDSTVQKMSQIITQSHLAMDILEFLGGLVRLPEAYRSTNLMLFRTIFGICKEYLKNSRAERQKPRSTYGSRVSYVATRAQFSFAEAPASSESRNTNDAQQDLPEYVFALAYHVITFWFLAIDIHERSSHVGWISKNLGYQNDLGQEVMEEQSQVTLDMMHRTGYSDLGETMPDPRFKDQGNKIIRKTWLHGMSIVTVETFKDNGLTQIIKRQASGTTYAVFQQQTAPLPPHHVQPRSVVSSYRSAESTHILPNHVFLQLSSTITPMPIPIQPIIIPDDDITRRAISTFDLNDTVDGHKAGVIYVGDGQSGEAEILANITGTDLYKEFLTGLGTKVSLQDAKFNTQGLDREFNSDGTHTYAWRDRVTEIVFHVTTMMPTDQEHDPQCINKKRHIGNDFVNIIYNDSGLPFDTDTFKSQFNYVNIIITPDSMAVTRRLPSMADSALGQSGAQHGSPQDRRVEAQVCFKVQTICSPSFPQISPAAKPKLVSAFTLPGFVRQLALNASVFSLVWSTRTGGEHVSSWRNRLRAIAKLRERYANTAVSGNVSYPDMGTREDRGGARSYVEGDPWQGTLMMGGLAEEKQMHLSLDFTRWA